ncbi:MAG: signal peptide peptidase SppA [Polyangiaceae bacterium]
MRRSPHVLAAALVALGLPLAIAGGARAEPPLSISEPLPSPGKGIASTDDAAATAVNPANLAFVPAPELRWTWVYTPEGAALPIRGHSLEFAAPLFFLGGGLRVDLMDPPNGAPQPFSQPYQWIRWSGGGRIDDWLAVGGSFAWSLSDSAKLDGQFSATVAATWRPAEWVSISGVVRDLNAPQSRDERFGSYRSWEAGVAVRPIAGLRSFELGLEARFYDQLGQGQVRALAGVDIPYVGRVRADARWLEANDKDPEFAVTAGLDVNFGPAQLSGGLVMANGLGLDPGQAFYAGAALRLYREPGIPFGKRVVRIDINDTPGVRGHVHLLRRLHRLATNPEVDGVVLVMKDEPAAALAYAEELGDALRMLRAHGKKVACHLEDAGGRSLFVCSQADRIAMNPAGGLRFAGLSSRYFYFGGTLDKLGVKADFVRIGAHKSAAEQLTATHASPTSADDHQDLVDQYESVYLHDVGGGRKIPAGKLKDALAHGPFLASEARDAGLVDELVYPDEIGRFMEEVMGGPVTIQKSLPVSDAPKRWRRDSRIAVVYLNGDMVDGESEYIPIIGIKLAGSRTIASALKQARDDDSVKAVVFRVETGGGSSLAADVILREAQLTAKKKPVVISMGSAAASGGYYVAVGGGPIFANRATLTGSIGIFYGKVDVTGLMEKLGVGSDAFRSSPRADAETFFRGFTEDERVELTKKVKQFYDLFVARVSDGRHLTIDEVDAVARGRVWSGQQALERKLVDKIGGFREALEEARRLGDAPEDAAILELPVEDDSLFGFLLKQLGLSASAAEHPFFLPPALVDVARALAPFMVYEAEMPLARTELFEDGAITAKFSQRGTEDTTAYDEDGFE